MFEVSTILHEESAELVSRGANRFVVVSMFGEVLVEGASLSMMVEEDTLVVSGGGRVTAEIVVDTTLRGLNEILEEDFKALLNEGSEILHSIEGTILEEKLFAEFDEFMAMNIKEKSKSDTEEPPSETIIFNTDYKIKTSLEEPHSDLELKPLPDHLEYVFLEEPTFLSVIIASQLSEQNRNKLISVLKRHKQAIAWKTTDIRRICPSFCKHKIQLLKDKKPVI
nr:reverse transcriptase domain-containing protein [Tanacetum cinerariifolium]